jgi:endonuclease/exonuclease/phosphatase family metal-dependent hydrolase
MVSSLLTVMTWNIWFDKTNRSQRIEILLNEVRSYDPDIVALQEVVPESMEIIIAKMHPTYYIIGVNPNGFPAGYDTLILSKFPPIQWDRYNLPNTKMGRNLLLTTLQTPSRQITVGTFHLESVFFPKIKTAEELKESQLKYIYAISPMNSILMGDTNLVINNEPYLFTSFESPKSPNNPPIIDVFHISLPLPLSERGIPPNDELPLPLSEKGIPPNDEPVSSPNQSYMGEKNVSSSQTDVGASQPNVSGLGVSPFLKGAATYCGHTNKHIKNKSIQSRLDRIYVKIKRNSLKVHFYGLTGTVTQPSDHYGVFAQIEI